MQRLGNPNRTNLQCPGKHEQPEQESDRGQAEVDRQPFSYSRTTNTGQWACLTTDSETLPISALLRPPSPLLPITIVPTPSSSLSLTISLSGSPVSRCVSATFPPDSPSCLACSSRNERASPSACSRTDRMTSWE